jgi:hypothetical protein
MKPIEVQCPGCGETLKVEIEEEKTARFLNWGVIVPGILGLLALTAMMCLISTRLDLRRSQRIIADLNSMIGSTKKDAASLEASLVETRRIVANEISRAKAEVNSAALAKKQADLAKQQAEQFIAVQKGELFKTYPRLQSFLDGKNNVGRNYLDYFEVTGKKITTHMTNPGKEDAKPDFEIYFLDRSGFVSGIFRKSWLFDRIKAQETRVDTDSVSFWYGQPTYFDVRFSSDNP